MTNEELEQKIKNVLENSYIGTNYDGNYRFNAVRTAMLNFAFEMCELQKQICAENATLTTKYTMSRGRDSEMQKHCEVNKNSILESPNVLLAKFD